MIFYCWEHIEGKRRSVTVARDLSVSLTTLYKYDMRPPMEDEQGSSDGGTVIYASTPDCRCFHRTWKVTVLFTGTMACDGC